MTCRPALVFALALTPVAVAAQLAEVGGGAALSYAQYLDVPRQCCPPLVWAAFGSGRWRLHVDYLRSYREVESGGYYPIDDIDGQRASIQRVSLHLEPRDEANFLVSWRALERPGYSLNILFGAHYRRSRVSTCLATAGPIVRLPAPADDPPDDAGRWGGIVFRQELTSEERSRCADDHYTLQAILPQAAAALDVPLGERFFFRAGARFWLFQADAGIGVKF